MRLKIFAAVALIVVGVAAIGVVIIGPSFGSGSSVQYITATAAVTNVTQSSAATGSLAPSITYGLAFGRNPVVVGSSSSSSASSSSSSGSGTGSGGSSTTWPVSSVSVTVGSVVTKGQVLAVADSASATQALSAAQSNLAIAQARLASDEGGLTAVDKAMARLSITQAEQQLSNARTSESDTRTQNNLSISTANAALSQAKATLSADEAASAPAQQIDQDKAAVTSATQNVAQTKAKATQSNNQAAESVASAELQVTSAQQGYESKTAAAPALTILSDKASVTSAQTAVDSAEATVKLATISAPADGTITAVSLVAGLDAPSGDAIEMEGAQMQVTASFAETDLPSLKVGQSATIAITATNETATGKLTEIDPVASSSGSSSVVTYPVVISLDTTPSDVKAGMSASVSITTAEADNVIAVPAIALVGSSGSYGVRVMGADGTISTVPVTVGLITTQYAAITGGVSAGDTVVVGVSTPRTSTAATTTNAGSLTGGFGGFGGGGAFPAGGGTRRGQP
ncbi:MAG TPA: HlyD family efflux transporter periplasmic adaptor subunit [Candidatus Limnocylindrales bacterium]|jgi:multidrug efflux pump subunit AcrA (membrane-fusion protein)